MGLLATMVLVAGAGMVVAMYEFVVLAAVVLLTLHDFHEMFSISMPVHTPHCGCFAKGGSVMLISQDLALGRTKWLHSHSTTS